MYLDDVNAFPFEAFEFPFNLELCGTTVCDEMMIWKHTPCRNYVVEYIVSGRGTLIYDGKTYHPQAGDCYILHKGKDCEYYPDPEDPWSKIWLNCDGILLVNLLVSYDLFDTVLIKGLYQEEIFREMLSLANSSKPAKDIVFEMSLRLHELLILIYKHLNQHYVKSTANDIKRILDANIYNGDFRMEQLSALLHLSQTHIINTFKEAYNQTPYRYYLEQRIQIACSLLLNTEMSIRRIAETLHFADQHYFSNAFKTVMSKSPQQYKKEYQTLYIKISNLHMKKH